MDYVCVHARFLFFDWKSHYTVEYSYGIGKWFVFEDEKTTDALYVSKEIKPSKSKSPNREEAKVILKEYFSSVIV